MLPQKNNVAPIRNQIIVKVAQSFIKDRFKNADAIPSEIMPDGSFFYHASIDIDREIIKILPWQLWAFLRLMKKAKINL